VRLALSTTLLVSNCRKSLDADVLLGCGALRGSFALGHYGKPRMTRDLDFVVALMERHVDALVSAFSTDFYIDENVARSAIKSQRMFNLMHLDSAIKVDLIVRKNSEYRHAEFEPSKLVEFAGISTWITSREDLILQSLFGHATRARKCNCATSAR
jgi:hypothetical protein